MSKELIAEYLKLNPDSSAREIALSLNLDKGEINSILYSGSNVDFSKVDGSPPRWRAFKKTVSRGDLISEYLQLRNNSTFIIDSHGLVWHVRVVIRSQSRNDPFFVVERISPTERIVTISDALIQEQEIVENMILPDSILAIAASAIAWEISVSKKDYEREEFDFGVALTDMFMSLASQNAI